MSDIPNKLRFCCLPVLPTIFSDELSYLDVLSKMRDYINQMIDAIKQQDEDIANIQTQVDKVDPSKYIQTSGGTLTGPLFFIDKAHVLKNEDGTITLSGTGLMNIHGGGNVTIDTPESIAIRADKHVDITGSGGVEILASENGVVNIEGGAVAMTGDINVHGPMNFDQNSVVKNADGTFTVQSNNPVVLKAGQTVAVNATGGIELRSGGTALITGDDGVSILDKTAAGVTVYEGNTAIAGNIEINGPTTFGNVDVDMVNARTKVAEPVEDANPATKKYVDARGVTCGYITNTVDDSKTTVDVRNENLIPQGVLGGYYVDNAGNLWHATQVVVGGFTLENQNINVLANAEFVKITGNTSVKNINVNDTGSSTYQATTNVLVHGGTDVGITAGGTVGVQGPVVDIHAAKHVNLVTDSNGDIIIGANGHTMLLSNNNISLSSAQSGDAGIARLIDIPYNQKAQFGNFTFAARDSKDYRVFMIANSSDAPVANVTAPVFMVFSAASRGVRDGIAVDSAGVIYKVIHNYNRQSFEMAKQTPNAGGAAMKQFDTTNGVPMIPIANIPASGGAIFYMTITVGDKNNQNNSQLYNGSITTYNGEVADVRILNIGWLSSSTGVECNWLDDSQVTKTTDGIQLDISATDAGFTGWYSKLS